METLMKRWLAAPILLLAILVAPAAAMAAGGDRDHDGLSNARERKIGTNPRKADTDRDGLKDRAEVVRWHTNPKRADTDRGGVKEGAGERAGPTPRGPASKPSRGVLAPIAGAAPIAPPPLPIPIPPLPLP